MAVAARSMTCAPVFGSEVSVQTESVVSPTLPLVDFPAVARAWLVVRDGFASVQTDIVVPSRISCGVDETFDDANVRNVGSGVGTCLGGWVRVADESGFLLRKWRSSPGGDDVWSPRSCREGHH